MLELRYFLASDGGSPFEEWFVGLNAASAAKVAVALARLEQGNLSKAKAVGEGVLEYRIDWGPGYRVYFGRDGMFGQRGNPQARNLFGIIGYLQRQAGIELHVTPQPR